VLSRCVRVLACALACGLSSCGGEPEPEPAPRLVVVLVIDQLRPDRLDRGLPGGLGRLLREGRSFSGALLDHAHTDTCPGHLSLMSGRHPGPIGVPGNTFIDRDSFEPRYCVDDMEDDARVIGGRGGRSPRNIEASALGDWMKTHWPESRVFTVSAKDRAAIAMGGQRPDAAFWIDRRGSGGFTTSRYYRDALPAWLDGWQLGELVARVPEHWEYPVRDREEGIRSDEYASENPAFGRTSPHPLVVPDDPRGTLLRVISSPYIDELTLAFARELVEREQLGRGPAPDLLAVSLSGVDLVGHLYGPWSQESLDTLLRLDAAVAGFLLFLEDWVARGELLVVLSSDHGVLPMPEWLWSRGESACPLPEGRGEPEELEAELEAALAAEFGQAPARGEEPGRWLARAGYRLTVNREAAASAGVGVDRVVALARGLLEAEPGIERVWTAGEIEKGAGPEPYAHLYRNSHHALRGGDLIVQPMRDCLFSPYDFGTNHGSPYLYDREVPLVFFGSGVRPGESTRAVSTVDVAPTLAKRLGIEPPPALDGHALPLDGSE